jgi:hypothetical protein
MGEADAEGSKSTILSLPLVASLLVMGMGAIKRIKVDESAKQEPAFIYPKIYWRDGKTQEGV